MHSKQNSILVQDDFEFEMRINESADVLSTPSKKLLPRGEPEPKSIIQMQRHVPPAKPPRKDISPFVKKPPKSRLMDGTVSYKKKVESAKEQIEKNQINQQVTPNRITGASPNR